jgi:hypothetical protein
MNEPNRLRERKKKINGNNPSRGGSYGLFLDARCSG